MKHQPIAKHEAYSRVTITIPTFAIIIVRQLAKRANEKRPGSQTVSGLLESWLLPTFSADEITALGKTSPDFKRAAEAWIRWEAQERAKRKPDLRAKR
jgi:hypothetical protein